MTGDVLTYRSALHMHISTRLNKIKRLKFTQCALRLRYFNILINSGL